ncbi:MAG: hypothetical protein M1546_00120 [Chloroflexi bacterium]|nr:hypothetical protein [Chloroflexota bacterium]
MTQSWRNELRTWANQCADRFGNRQGILGVVVGGSLARGQEWRHSDLELGALVEERDGALSYFNVDAGRGVEVLQLVRPELEEQVRLVEGGDLMPILNWPIQLWTCRIMQDPSGLLGRFKRQFDAGLFAGAVVEKRMAGLRLKIDKALGEARHLLAEDRPAAALAKTRLAMNDAILAFHWAHGELPRSQNRTHSRLRLLCQKHTAPSFYALYRDVFALSDTTHVIKNTWPNVKGQVLDIARLWGDSAHDFFVHAVDSDFAWRQNAGILTVYRLYIPVIGTPERGVFEKLDDSAWAAENRDLMQFLGLAHADKAVVSTLVERIEGTLSTDSAPNTARAD